MRDQIKIGYIKSCARCGDRVTVYFPNGKSAKFIASNDLTSTKVAVIGERAFSEDVAQQQLVITTKLFKSKQNYDDAEERLIAASVLYAISSFYDNPENIYNYESFQIESLLPETQGFTSWKYISDGTSPNHCIAVEDGSGNYATSGSCIAANSNGNTIRREDNPFTRLYYHNFSGATLPLLPGWDYSGGVIDTEMWSLGSESRIAFDDWAYKSNVYRSNFIRGLPSRDQPTWNYPGQTIKIQWIMVIHPDLVGTGKFYEATYVDGLGRTATISYTHAEYARNGSIISTDYSVLNDPAHVYPREADREVIMSELQFTVPNNGLPIDFNFFDLIGLTLPAGIPTATDLFGVPIIGFNVPFADKVKYREINPVVDHEDIDVIIASNTISCTSRKQSHYVKTRIYSDIDYNHIVNSGHLHYFVKVHDPNFPLLKVAKIPNGRLHRIFFVFLGDIGYFFIKIGKTSNPEVSFDERPWYQVKVIKIKVTKKNESALEEVQSDTGDFRLIKSEETDFIYPQPIKIDDLDLEDFSDLVIKNKLGYLDAPIVNPSQCFDAEKYHAFEYFLETNFQKDKGKIFEYKVPGKLIQRRPD